MSEVTDGEPVELQRQPLAEHIAELRTRLLRMFAIVVVGIIAAWFFHAEIYAWLMEPYAASMSERFPEMAPDLEFRSLTEPFTVYLKASAMAAIIALVPYLLLELWLFVVPGLYARERKMGARFLFASLVLFYSGVAFCRYVVLGPAVFVLLGFGEVNTSPSIMMLEYMNFTTRLLFVFGGLFELPVVITFLSLVGLITHRQLLKHWRIAVVVTFVVGAMLTPPDPLTQLALAVPLSALYAVSIAISWMITRGRERRRAAEG